jgi:hypothetical protein
MAGALTSTNVNAAADFTMFRTVFLPYMSWRLCRSTVIVWFISHEFKQAAAPQPMTFGRGRRP